MAAAHRHCQALGPRPSATQYLGCLGAQARMVDGSSLVQGASSTASGATSAIPPHVRACIPAPGPSALPLTNGTSSITRCIVTPGRLDSKGGTTNVPSWSSTARFMFGPSHTQPSLSTKMPCGPGSSGEWGEGAPATIAQTHRCSPGAGASHQRPPPTAQSLSAGPQPPLTAIPPHTHTAQACSLLPPQPRLVHSPPHTQPRLAWSNPSACASMTARALGR